MSDYQQLAPNATSGIDQSYLGDDARKIHSREMPNNRMNDYVTNMYAGPGSHKGSVKMKGKVEHSKHEDEIGDDYGM